MANGDIIQVRIDSIAGGGEGLAQYEKGKIFAAFSAPGDLLRVRINEEHPGWARGEIVEIEEASPLRADPVCPLYGRCGGCSLRHMSYGAQLSAKEGIVRDCFSRFAGEAALEGLDLRIRPSPPAGYRNRVQFHCLPGDRGRLGLKEARGNGVVPLSVCPVAEEGINRALKEGTIKPPPEKDRFTVYSRNGLFLSEGGKSRGRVSVGGKDLMMDAGVFFQSNAVMLEALLPDLKAAAEHADRGLPMADLYCGVGTLAAFLAPDFPAADLVEKNRAALALARENVPARGGSGRRFFALSGDEWAARNTKRFGFISADPPREGMTPLLRKHLAENGPEILAYVSCDPATLARDAKELTAGAYKLKELKLYDFYPQTAHIESLAVFSKK